MVRSTLPSPPSQEVRVNAFVLTPGSPDPAPAGPIELTTIDSCCCWILTNVDGGVSITVGKRSKRRDQRVAASREHVAPFAPG